MITLVTGGARSGKSTWALEQALANPLKRYFIATATAFDSEMEQRINLHKYERGSTFTTVEEPYDLLTAIQACDTDSSIILVDCLTVWIGNLFYKNSDDPACVRPHIDYLAESIASVKNDCIIVTNEVGMGLVPETPLGRLFRDLAGRANQVVADASDEVFLVVCGQPLQIKPPSQSVK